jgi:hypothetical protein
MPSRKQEIYRDILLWVLPQMRSLPTFGDWFWGRGGRVHRLAQLVHDLPVTILEPEFGDHDLWFLNKHARYYFKRGTPDLRIQDHVAELFRIVPDDLRHKLEWAGPRHRE